MYMAIGTSMTHLILITYIIVHSIKKTQHTETQYTYSRELTTENAAALIQHFRRILQRVYWKHRSKTTHVTRKVTII